MTSLQRAAAAVQSKPSLGASQGNFEKCFASGLDLSEFGSSAGSSSQGPRPSAASQLLRIKQEESKRKQTEAAADHCMDQIVQRRISNVQKVAEKGKLGGESAIAINAIVRMHGSDVRGGSKQEKKLKKQKLRSNAAPKSPAMSKAKAVKKSRKSKY